MLNNLESTTGRQEARNSSSGGDNRQGPEGPHGRKSEKAPLGNKLDFRNGVLVAQNGTFTQQQACAQYPDMCPAGQEAGVRDAIGRRVQEPIADAVDGVDKVATGAAKEIVTLPVKMTATGMLARVGKFFSSTLSFRRASVADDVVVVTAGGAARAGTTVFKTEHYASRLEAAGVNVARAESAVAKEVAAMRQNLATGADVGGRLRIDDVLVEYRARLLPDGSVNVGTIFPVR